jgi:hypothetical protein
MGVTLTAGGTGYFEDNLRSSVLWFNTSSQRMEFEFEKMYFVDGVPFDNDQSYSSGAVPLGPILNDIPLTSHIGIGICHDYFGQWKEAIYDPQLSTIFLRPPTPSDGPQSPQTKKQSSIVRIVAPVVVVGVVALVGIAVLLVMFVPSLRTSFLPSQARSLDSRQTEEKTRKSNKQSTKQATPTPTSTSPAVAASAAPAASNAHPSGWTKSERPT